MEHLENHFEGDFEEREIFVNLLTFDEPVGVFVPNGGIEGFDGFREAIMLKVIFDGFFASGKLAADPIFAEMIGGIGGLFAGLNLAFVDDGGGEFLVQNFDGNRGIGMGLVDERLDKAGDIPEFITQVATRDNGIFGESLVHASRAATENAKAESVGAVFGDHIHGIDNVAFALGHLLAVGVENETMKINFAEGNFAGDIEAHHDHAGDPGEENVSAGFHDVQGVVRVFLTFGPVGTDNGPVGAREPGIESVLVAVIGDATDFDFGEIYTGIKDPFGSVRGFGLAEHGNGDTPRNLTGNIPVFKAFEIIDENFLFASGVELDFAFLEVFDSGPCETLDVDEPLRFEHRLDDGATFVAVSDGVGDFLGAAQETLAFEFAQDFLTGF